MTKQQRKNETELSSMESRGKVSVESAGTYRIRVRGHIDESLADQLGGMIITRAFTSEKDPMTILIGHMRDQAALSGVLNELYELHLPLLTVELLP
jgi:hypothetical protein